MVVRILIVDDDKAVRFILDRKLTKLGYETEAAVDGQEAVELVKVNHYGLIFMDIRMPKMDGFQATRAIRTIETEEGREPIPIVALSAHPDPPKCREAGMNDFYEKPMLDEQFQEIFAKWLKPEWKRTASDD